MYSRQLNIGPYPIVPLLGKKSEPVGGQPLIDLFTLPSGTEVGPSDDYQLMIRLYRNPLQYSRFIQSAAFHVAPPTVIEFGKLV